MSISMFPFAPQNLVSRGRFSAWMWRMRGPTPSRVSPFTLHIRCSPTLRFPRRRPPKPSTAIGSARSFIRACSCVPMAFIGQHRASNPQAGSSNGCCLLYLGNPMDQTLGIEADKELVRIYAYSSDQADLASTCSRSAEQGK